MIFLIFYGAASLLLLAMYFPLYLAFGIGDNWNLVREVTFSGGIILAMAGMYYANRKRLAALIMFGAALAILIFLYNYKSDREIAERIRGDAASAELNRQENDEILRSATTVAPCSNGNVAVIHTLRNPWVGSLMIIPANRGTMNSILVVVGEHSPAPNDSRVREYVSRYGECRNKTYGSLEALFDLLEMQYHAVHHGPEFRGRNL